MDESAANATVSPVPCGKLLQVFCVLREGHKGPCTRKFLEGEI